MTEKRYAVIDIGSNSVRMKLEGEPGVFSATTRLGAGLADSGRLDTERAKRSAAAIGAFAREAAERGFIPLAYATSAVRDAENQAEFLELVRLTAGIEVDVLSGEREALYAYAACGARGGLVDIGGASMQLVSKGFKRSFPVGCVRGRDIAERLHPLDANEPAVYPVQRARLGEYLEKLMEPYLLELESECFCPFIGVGGSILTLCALSADMNAPSKSVGHGVTLTRSGLEELISRLVCLGSERARIGALASRHDVILYGAALLSKAMDILRLDSVTASLIDGLDGYLDAAVRGEFDA